jgi:RND superfamily putative drug exporter
MPSVAALMGRWFWRPTQVRTRPASRMLRPYGSRWSVRALMLPKEESTDAENTDRFSVTTPHY